MLHLYNNRRYINVRSPPLPQMEPASCAVCPAIYVTYLTTIGKRNPGIGPRSENRSFGIEPGSRAEYRRSSARLQTNASPSSPVPLGRGSVEAI